MDGRLLVPRGALFDVGRQQEKPEQSKSPSAPSQTEITGDSTGFPERQARGAIKMLSFVWGGTNRRPRTRVPLAVCFPGQAWRGTCP